MSIYAQTLVRKSGLVKTVNTIAMEYADRADDEGRGIYPSIARIAYDTGYDERTVQRATKELKTAGILQFVGIHPTYKTNEYRMIFSNLPPKSETFEDYKNRRGDKMSGVTLSASGGDTVSPKPSVIRQDNPPTPQGGSDPVANAPDEEAPAGGDADVPAFEEALTYFYSAARLPLPPIRRKKIYKKNGEPAWIETRWSKKRDLNPMRTIAALGGGKLDEVKRIIDSAIAYNRKTGEFESRNGEEFPVASPKSIMNTAQRFRTRADASPAASVWSDLSERLNRGELARPGALGEWNRKQTAFVRSVVRELGDRWFKATPNAREFFAAWDAVAAGGGA